MAEFIEINIPLKKLYFSFSGRIPGAIFFMCSFFLFLIFLLLSFVNFAFLMKFDEIFPILRYWIVVDIPLKVLIIWSYCAVSIKRVHDAGKPGWLILFPKLFLVVGLILVFGEINKSFGTKIVVEWVFMEFFVFVILCFLKGTNGLNQYRWSVQSGLSGNLDEN